MATLTTAVRDALQGSRFDDIASNTEDRHLPAAVEPHTNPEAKSDPESANVDQPEIDLGPARLRAGRERSFARRIAMKAVEIAAAPEPDRATLAGLLGCPADVVSLTAEVMGAPFGAPRLGR
jgi:hypothetical protein